jgi:hypothetical protein
VSLRSRLVRVERALGGSEPAVPHPKWRLWLSFKEFVFRILGEGGFTEALALLRNRVALNEPGALPVDQPLNGDREDVALWIMVETVWATVQRFPPAKEALEDALRRFEQNPATAPALADALWSCQQNKPVE